MLIKLYNVTRKHIVERPSASKGGVDLNLCMNNHDLRMINATIDLLNMSQVDMTILARLLLHMVALAHTLLSQDTLIPHSFHNMHLHTSPLRMKNI